MPGPGFTNELGALNTLDPGAVGQKRCTFVTKLFDCFSSMTRPLDWNLLSYVPGPEQDQLVKEITWVVEFSVDDLAFLHRVERSNIDLCVFVFLPLTHVISTGAHVLRGSESLVLIVGSSFTPLQIDCHFSNNFFFNN